MLRSVGTTAAGAGAADGVVVGTMQAGVGAVVWDGVAGAIAV